MNNYKLCGKYYYATTTNEDDMILIDEGPFYIDDLLSEDQEKNIIGSQHVLLFIKNE